MEIKIFHVAERYHFYDGVHDIQMKPNNCEEKKIVPILQIFISRQNIKCK